MMITRSTIAVQVGAFVCALAVSAEAAAATIYGFIRQDNQPVRTKEVVLNCGRTEAARAVTDNRGYYRITTARTGTCILVVGGASGDVVLYMEPTQYNFEISNARLIRR